MKPYACEQQPKNTFFPTRQKPSRHPNDLNTTGRLRNGCNPRPLKTMYFLRTDCFHYCCRHAHQVHLESSTAWLSDNTYCPYTLLPRGPQPGAQHRRSVYGVSRLECITHGLHACCSKQFGKKDLTRLRSSPHPFFTSTLGKSSDIWPMSTSAIVCARMRGALSRRCALFLTRLTQTRPDADVKHKYGSDEMPSSLTIRLRKKGPNSISTAAPQFGPSDHTRQIPGVFQAITPTGKRKDSGGGSCKRRDSGTHAAHENRHTGLERGTMTRLGGPETGPLSHPELGPKSGQDNPSPTVP